MRKAFTMVALAALLFAGAGLAGCAATKCCTDGSCAKCMAGKGECADCKAAGGMCEACKAKMAK